PFAIALEGRRNLAPGGVLGTRGGGWLGPSFSLALEERRNYHHLKSSRSQSERPFRRMPPCPIPTPASSIMLSSPPRSVVLISPPRSAAACINIWLGQSNPKEVCHTLSMVSMITSTFLPDCGKTRLCPM